LIVKNDFLNNSVYGIHISSENNAVYHNNFLNNTQNTYGSYYDTKWDNGYPSGGNYWDDYDGVDEDPEDGIGDTPYRISNNTEDKYPFMEPSGWDKNYPPHVVYFDGPSYGQPGIPYGFTAGLFDPDKDLWYVMFDWGDNSYSAWKGPYSNGEAIGIRHTWSKGFYNIRIKGKDINGVESNWSEPIKLRIESDPPTVEIIKPDKALYILNKRIIPRFIRWPLIIGTIDVTVVANDFTGIDKVEFYVDNELKSVDNSSPYIYTWIRDRLRFIHFHVLEVVAYDYVGNIASDKIIVRKFF